LYGLIKRARKYYLGVTTITQDVEDFVNSPFGKPIITNASLQILLKQSPTAVDNLQKLFYLTDGEKYLLLNSDIGQGLFFAGNKHVAIQIVASPQEELIITTNPEEVIAIRKAQKRDEKAKRLGEALIPKGVDSSGNVDSEKAAKEAAEKKSEEEAQAQQRGENDVTEAAEKRLEEDKDATDETPEGSDPTQSPAATLTQATPTEEDNNPANEPTPEPEPEKESEEEEEKEKE
jgi:hypothetical protein